MSTSEFNSIDDFLGHTSFESQGKYLRNWTKEGSVRIVLHTKRLPVASWRHPITTQVVFNDRDTDEEVVNFWGRPHVCWESEAFLKRQYRRDEDGNLEEGEPRLCSGCRLVDRVYRMILNKELDWADEVFRFDGATDDRNNLVIHAGGLTGIFKDDDLTDQEVKYLKSKGIRQSEAWKEDWHAKSAYVFTVVNYDKPGEGVMIDAETSLVGQKVQQVIKDMKRKYGDEAGNPVLNPYVIELQYKKNERVFNNKYHALPMENLKITPEIDRLIREKPPSLASTLRPFNQRLLRLFLEKHAVVDLPWDDIFNVPQLVADGDEEQQDPQREEAQEVRRDEPRQGGESKRTTPEAKMIPCDECKAPMRADQSKCGSCGVEYELDAEDQEPPPPPPKGKGKITGNRPPFARS